MDEGSESYSVAQVSRILGITEQRVRQLLAEEELVGEKRGGAWRVDARSVHARLESVGKGASSQQVDIADLLARIEELSQARGRAEGRLEITERAESSIREEMQVLREERERLAKELAEAREAQIRLEVEMEKARRGIWRRLFGRDP